MGRQSVTPISLTPTMYRQIVDAAPNAVVVSDAEGRIVLVNHQAEKLFGYSKGELLGQPVERLIPERFLQAHPDYRSQFVRKPQARSMGAGRDLFGRRKDGSEFPIEIGLNPLPTSRGMLILSAIVDITERKALEAELRLRLKELAHDAQQKNEFLAMLGHELRNPLAPISNAVQIMNIATADEQTQVNARRLMARQLEHLVRLVDDLLDVGRIIGGRIELKLTRMDFNEAVRRGIETALPAVEARGHQLVTELAPEPLWADCDMVRMAQVVTNLLTNASRYSPERRRIWVTTFLDARDVCLSVADEGTGIEADLLPHVFELFVQGKSDLARTQGGLGIGLTLAKRVVELHAGTIMGKSEGSGRGSLFTVRLPMSSATATAGVKVVGSRPVISPGAHRRVLIVDDNVDAAESLATILRLSGYAVHPVFNGKSALAALSVFRPDVVVLDIGLPDIDGYEVARRIRSSADFGSLPLVAVTGYGQPHDREQSRQAQIDLHLTKPVDMIALRSFVAAA